MSYIGKALLALVVAITAVLVIPAAMATPVGVSVGAYAPPSGAAASPAASSAASATALNPTAERILSSLHASGVPMSKIFLPNFNAKASVVNGVVSPLYAAYPAPMGLGDIGVREVAGKNVGTISYTKSVEGQLSLNSVNPLYLSAAGPDQFTVQLNTVAVNVQVFHNLDTDYWIQNVPVYYASSGTLAFEDNIWNFSNPQFYFPPNGIYAHGPDSFFIDDEVYIGVGPVTYHVAPPFTVTVYNNLTVWEKRPTIFFNFTLTKGSKTISGSYDFAQFNSTGSAAMPTKPSAKPVFQINGQAVNPTGFLLNDAEIMLGGPGGGSTTTLFGIDGSMGLWTLPNGTKTYQAVPAAYDFGTDTGETSEGIAEYSTGGPQPMARLVSGPSLLYPLWGLVGSVPSGAVAQVLHVTPSNAFVFVAPGSAFSDNSAAWAPVPASGWATYWLPPGTYSYNVLLSEYNPDTFSMPGAGARTVTLTSNPALGVYTPLWAWGNSQLAAISQGGTGTVNDPYVLYNNQVGAIDPLFGVFNDYIYPVFPGIQLVDTTAYVSVLQAPSFAITYALSPELAALKQFHLPLTNFLQYTFYGAKHVSVVGAPVIGGWMFADDTGATIASVVFWNSSDNLVAGNTFQIGSLGLILFGGTNNVIWGNTFAAVPPSTPDPGAIGFYGAEVALFLWESGDWIYNNAFLTPNTAFTPTTNVYNGAPAAYEDAWNIPMQPASNVRVVNGWDLSGSILGLAWQGGNYWSNYGNDANPYGQLPYNNGGGITWRGDHQPQVPFALVKVTFHEKGLPTGTSWSVTLNGVTKDTTKAYVNFWDPAGVYAFTVAATGYTASPSIGAVNVTTTTVDVVIAFS